MSFKNPIAISIVVPDFMGKMIDNFDEALAELTQNPGGPTSESAANLRFIYTHGLLASCLFGCDIPEPREVFAQALSQQLDELEESINPRDTSLDN